jgi:hypothetical protein
MTSPIRIQLSRAKGWRMPPNTVKVDRSTHWGNRYRVGDGEVQTWLGPAVIETAADAVAAFRADLEWKRGVDPDGFERWIAPLRGKNLACWCKPSAICHADVLLEWANR